MAETGISGRSRPCTEARQDSIKLAGYLKGILNAWKLIGILLTRELGFVSDGLSSNPFKMRPCLCEKLGVRRRDMNSTWTLQGHAMHRHWSGRRTWFRSHDENVRFKYSNSALPRHSPTHLSSSNYLSMRPISTNRKAVVGAHWRMIEPLLIPRHWHTPFQVVTQKHMKYQLQIIVSVRRIVLPALLICMNFDSILPDLCWGRTNLNSLEDTYFYQWSFPRAHQS